MESHHPRPEWHVLIGMQVTPGWGHAQAPGEAGPVSGLRLAIPSFTVPVGWDSSPVTVMRTKTSGHVNAGKAKPKDPK